MIFPASSALRSRPIWRNAPYGTDTSTTSPNSAASRGVPTLAFDPSDWASGLNSSGWREEISTSCPAGTRIGPGAADNLY